MRSSRNDTIFMNSVRQDLCRYISTSPEKVFAINKLSRDTGISRCLALDVIMKEKLLSKNYKTHKYYRL